MPEPADPVLMISLHTSPLAQPGTGDAGGMNVYVRHLARELVAAGQPVDLAVLDRSPGAPRGPRTTTTEVAPGLRLHEVAVPGGAGAAKEQLPPLVPAFAAALAAALPEAPRAVHAHYWLSGEAGLRIAEAAGVPLVLGLHTTARAKNLRAAADEPPEPAARADAEERLIARAEATVVNTRAEAEQLVALYGADPRRLAVVAPGVDLAVFRPGPAAERPAPPDRALRVLFAGRLQPLKGPQVLVEALGALRQDPSAPAVELELAGVGDPAFAAALRERVRSLGLAGAVRFCGALPEAGLAQRMRRADVVAVPSSSETFGLVALEAQACGTPVLATDVDGLRTAVLDGVTGRLVPDRSPEAWAHALADLAARPAALERLGQAAARRARGFSWAATARATAEVYERARARVPGTGAHTLGA
ncbi:glycosyltransferase [Kocuria flava]|uniref:glycosyltransferase n=1 Tax=Kocuria flava TaxID=446860 RepID=UPI001FF11253|nr:glycosyltransferase [Kocuria flava]MCJ8505709.1 glycosyltransferase [Kocuria flava]